MECKILSLIAVPRMSQRHNLRNGEGWISGWEFRYFPAVPERITNNEPSADIFVRCRSV